MQNFINRTTNNTTIFPCLHFQIFTNTKIWCYRITSLICALPVSFCWGIYFACFAFHNIWILMPCLKAYGMNLRILRSCFNSIIETFVKPCYLAAGYVFYNIRILKGGNADQRMRITNQLYFDITYDIHAILIDFETDDSYL